MKNFIIGLLLAHLTHASFAQDTTSTETFNPYGLSNESAALLHESFNVGKSEQIDKLERIFKINIDNPISCLMLLHYGTIDPPVLDSSDINALHERLKILADSMVNRATPIYILDQSHGSIEYAMRLNTEENNYNLRYVSLGNSCTTHNKAESQGVDIFNKQIYKRLGLEEPHVDEKRKPKKKTRKIRKKSN